jgi:hypothetical protein
MHHGRPPHGVLSINVRAVPHEHIDGVEIANIARHRREMQRALPLGRA